MEKKIYAKEYEDYLITGKEESLNSLANGSIEKDYFILIRKILNEDLTYELQSEIDFFLERIPESQSYRLKALNIFKKLQNFPERKREIIQDIKKLFNLGDVKTYNKPSTYNKSSNNNENNQSSNKYPNILKESEYKKYDYFIEDLYSGNLSLYDNEEVFFYDYDIYSYDSQNLNLDFNKIPEDIFVEVFRNPKYYPFLIKQIINSITYAKLDNFKEIIKTIIEQSLIDDETKKQFRDLIIENKKIFLNEQIYAILEYNTTFNFDELFSELILRKYSEISEDKKEKIKNLKEIKNLLKKYRFRDYRMIRNVFISILVLNSQINNFDFDLFIEFIKCPLFDYPLLYNITNELRKEIEYNKYPKDNLEYQKEVKIIEKYLKHFYLKEKMKLEDFFEYFNEDFIQKFYSKMQFYLGKEEPTKDNILSFNEINDLMKEVILTICDFNKELFNVNDDIELFLEIKNIQTLYVNVYEINTENYYYLNKKQFDVNISLEGIVPTYEDIYSYNDKPQLITEKKINIAKIPKKRGLYVIEFIGNGHVSRAVIQKGNLRCIYKNTFNGMVFYILDEYNKICKGEKTGIWLNNVWYPSIKETGAILIPYSTKGDLLILKHEDFCCLGTNIYIPDENYKLNGLFIINKESFIMGNITKILVRPYLFICDELCPLENLKNVKIKITSIKTENNQEIPSVNIIDKVELNYNKEFSFEFQVPPNLKSVNFELNGEIKYKTKDYIETLKFDKEYLFSRDYECEYLFKKDDNGNFIVNLLGKNGEPKKNREIKLNLYDIYDNDFFYISLESDSEGKINLGNLNNIKNAEINKEIFEIMKKINYSYLNEITIIESQELSLPFSSLGLIHLLKVYNDSIIEDLSDLLKVEITDKKNNLCYVKLPKLSEGNYILKADLSSTMNQLNIKIKVIKGKVMDITDYIISDNGEILYNNNQESILAIENISYNNKELKIKLNKNNKSKNYPRIHINCVQYMPRIYNSDILRFYKTQFYEYNQNKNKKTFGYNENKNKYLNNKILSDEIQYVLDRKQYDINLGNSLDKPSLLLKPQYIQDTHTRIIEGDKGEDFTENLNEKEKTRKYSNEKDTYNKELKDFDDEKIIKTFDFINISPYIKENLIPDENGEIIIKDIDLSEYSFVHILGIDNISCCEDYISLRNGITPLKDLRAINELDFNKNYCEFRKIYPLLKNEKHHINNITSIKYKIFDSLEKYIEYIKLINPSLENEIKEYEFLLNFSDLNLKEKLEKTSKYFSHELNIYLYFHHNDFFNKYIYPILKYKSEKTFIDYFLLNDEEKIIEYINTQNISELNTFEKCLLIYIIRKKNRQLSNRLARQIRAECPKENQKELKRLFNIALNLKSIEEEKIEKEIIDEKEDIIIMKYMKCDSIGDFAKKKKKKAKYKKVLKYDKYDKKSENLFDIDEKEAERINVKAQLFKEEGKSKEYSETQYYNKVYQNIESKNLVNPNNFFADLAQFWSENIDSERNIGFKTDNILTKPDNFTEFIFMLAVLDLEEKTLPKSQKLIKDKGLGLTIEANTNIYLLTKEINETELNIDNKYSLILAQMVYEDDKNINEEKEPIKFLVGKTYLQKTYVTNISPDNIICEILIQIPEGSLPIKSDEYKIIETSNINSYKSVIFEQKFYFPEEGIFKQYPASASINNLVIAKSGLKTYEVVSSIKLSKEEISSIEDVLNQGNNNEILEYIKKCDIIKEKDLEKIYWMLDDKEFYNNLINILKDKFLYNDNIWEYSLKNEDIDSLQEYIFNKKDKTKFKSIGNEFDYQFLKIDKTNNAHILNHLDYHPIFKNRVFKLPKSKSVLVVQLRDTYQEYITYLITLPKIKDYQYMRLCYYLILQSRIKEATIVYNKINGQNISENNLSSLELQYDYLTAYLDFSNGYPKFEKARKIIKKYKNISLTSWRNMFNEIEDQLNEYDEKINYDEEINKEENKLSNKRFKAEKEEILMIEKKGQDINIIYKNISELTIKYYLIDIEILFSRSPFVKNAKVDFGFVKPQITENIKVNNEYKENIYTLKIPKDLKNKDFLIEVSSNKKRENEIYYSSLLKYTVIESIGEIKIMDSNLKPLPEVYVKCFCETNNGNIKFYKDGFTDLRGKFDYVSLNNDLINEVKKFALLMVSKEYGSIIVYCNPPSLIKDKSGKNSIEDIFDLRILIKNKYRK